MNIVILTGRLANDPELKQTQSGLEICTVSIAVDPVYTKKGEEKKSDFFNLVAFGANATNIAKYFSKGSGIEITGRLQNNSWQDKETGKTRYSTNIVVDKWEFPKGAKPNRNSPAARGEEPRPTNANTFNADEFEEVEDDGLPF